MTIIKRTAMFLALFAAQLAVAAACHGQEADHPSAIATATYPDGVQMILTDHDVGECLAMGSFAPSGKSFVPGCWEVEDDHIKVTFLLADNTEWVEEYPLSDFRLTWYGIKLGRKLIHVQPA